MGWKRFAAACLLIAIAAPIAAAHGPSRQKVKESVEINAAPEKVWAKIGSFQDMSWHPAIAKTEGQGGNQAKAVRVLTLQGGGAINELLDSYDAGKMAYAYRITEVDVKVLPVTNYSSRIAVKASGEGKTLVEWSGAFYRGFPNNDPPPELSDEAASKAVSGVYRAGLDNLKKLIEAGSS